MNPIFGVNASRLYAVAIAAILLWFGAAGEMGAQDCPSSTTVNDVTQLAGAFNCDVFSLPIDPPTFQAWLIDPQFIWADFANLPEQFGAAFGESQEQNHGVTVLKLRLTRSILTGETLVEFPASTNTVILAEPGGYQTNQVDSASRSGWPMFKTNQPTMLRLPPKMPLVRKSHR